MSKVKIDTDKMSNGEIPEVINKAREVITAHTTSSITIELFDVKFLKRMRPIKRDEQN